MPLNVGQGGPAHRPQALELRGCCPSQGGALGARGLRAKHEAGGHAAARGPGTVTQGHEAAAAPHQPRGRLRLLSAPPRPRRARALHSPPGTG